MEISIIAPLTLVITSQVWKVTFSFSHLGISGQKHINTRWQTHCVSLHIYQGCSCALTCSPPLHLLSHMLGHTPLQVFPSFSSHTHGCRNKVRSSFRKQTNKKTQHTHMKTLYKHGNGSQSKQSDHVYLQQSNTGVCSRG